MQKLENLKAGFRHFHQKYFTGDKPHFEELKSGQSPEIMFISCCDSRVNPATITNCDPGDIFSIRNVANLVPPYRDDDNAYSVSSALEYAVKFLKVKKIIIMGHANCGGINALLSCDYQNKKTDFIEDWMKLALPARCEVLREYENQPQLVKQEKLERAAIKLSLKNLKSFPFVKTAMEKEELQIHGWYFDLIKGELLEHDAVTDEFKRID
jgi:carbonic anhydrase